MPDEIDPRIRDLVIRTHKTASSKMPTGKELQAVTPPQPKSNGQDPGLDPKITHMVDFLERAIRTQNPTVGTFIAAVGIMLGRKGLNPENLERVIYDVNSAIRVGYYLHYIKGK